MKKLFLTLLCCSFLFATDKLFYFVKTKGAFSYVGIKDSLGNILIPAQMYNYRNFEDGEVVRSKILSFYGCPKNIKREKHSCGCVFDRKGNFLYQTFMFDNGADYFREGYQRIVKNGKMGFANRHGKIVIDPKYDFVSFFNYGYATFSNGCHWETTDGGEHSRIVGGKWGVINFRGEKVLPLKRKTSKKDVKINGKYYPYPFSYSQEEKKILSFFESKRKCLVNIFYSHYGATREEKKVLYFEIVEHPSSDFTYYVVNVYNYKKIFQDKFWVLKNSNEVFYVNFFDEKIPFDKWLAKELEKIKN